MMRRSISLRLPGAVLPLVLVLAGCVAAPPLSEPPKKAVLAPNFSLSHIPQLPHTEVNNDQAYTLAELIDLAQQNNPTTRIAWLEAEQAALAAGLVKATYLPLITASVIGGYQRAKWTSEVDLGPFEIPLPSQNVTTKGVVPALNLNWLLFDFGKRDALYKAANNMAFASQAQFTAAHQAIIFNTTRTFYEYSTARRNTELAQQHLTNSKALKAAAQARFEAGLGTSIEVAQASQLAAQAQFFLVQRQSAERDSYQAVLSSIGLPPTTEISIANAIGYALPRFEDLPNDEALREALAYRPDLQATDAARQAAEQGIASAEANFMPKVGLIGVTAGGSTRFNVNNLGETGPSSASHAVLLGITIPLYDGGLRRLNLREAEARAQAARELVRKTQNDALREMHFAANALRSALEAHEAATELVHAATITNKAAVEAYKVGASSMILATEATNGLLDAQQAQAVAYSAALIATANLDFMMGQLNAAPTVQSDY